MNFHDSEKMAGILKKNNYEIVNSFENSDVIILNTCSVRSHAEKKVYSQIGRLKILKEKNPSLVLGITGCVAKDKGENLIKKMPYLNFIISADNIIDIANVIKKCMNGSTKSIVHIKENETFDEDFSFRMCKFKAYVSIMKGCNNFCSYCIVPYVRGREISKNPDDILKEVEYLIKQGVKEITLLGQNVNSYGLNFKSFKIDFADLLSQCSQISNFTRIRFVTSHPKDISEKLIMVIKENKNICEHLHLPLQSGSDKILQAMNRGYTLNKYKEIIKKVREIIPQISITTDLIVGFPGESDADFEETLLAVKEIKFDSAFTFKYSNREKTKASLLNNQIQEEIKQIRLQKLINLQKEITYEINKKLEGKTLEVLFEEISKKSKNEISGRTRTNKIVIANGNEKDIGEIHSVKIENSLGYTLKGKILTF